MSKKQIVEKIMDEYEKYGLSRIVVEIVYLMAILWRVPKESIYPGMRMNFNKAYGIEDDAPAIEAGKALFNSAIEDVKNENPEANDKDIADGIVYVGIDSLEESLEDIDFALLDKVKESMLQSTRNFVSENV